MTINEWLVILLATSLAAHSLVLMFAISCRREIRRARLECEMLRRVIARRKDYLRRAAESLECVLKSIREVSEN